MAPRMVFRKSMRKSARQSQTLLDFDLAEQSAVMQAEPSPPKSPEAYPYGIGLCSVRHLPIKLIVEDNVALNYLLCFARQEFSSEPVEFLASHREMERERTRMAFAPDPLLVRQLLSAMLEAHVAEKAQMQVTLPGSAVVGLRAWLSSYSSASPKDQANQALPISDLDTAIKQCMVSKTSFDPRHRPSSLPSIPPPRSPHLQPHSHPHRSPQSDVKNDMLPRFYSSPLGAELTKIHVGALLSHRAGQSAFKQLQLSPVEQSALDFWVAADACAKLDAGSERRKQFQEVYDTYAPKMPLFEVPVEECQRIEKALSSDPQPDVFITAQTYASNQLTEQYYKIMDGAAGGGGLLKLLGCARCTHCWSP